MTDIGERLHAIRAHLQTGALGQREVWETWLTEAAAEIERLREALQAMMDGEPNAAQLAARALEPKP